MYVSGGIRPHFHYEILVFRVTGSIKESGIARFDFIQQQQDPTRYVLVEVYRTAEDPAKHKETSHYKKWRDSVAGMMAEPRSAIKYDNVFPNDEEWD